MYNVKNCQFSNKKLSFVELNVFDLIEYFNSEDATDVKRSVRFSSFGIQNKNILSIFLHEFRLKSKKYPKVRKNRKKLYFDELVLTQFALFGNRITWDLKLKHTASSSCN